MYIRVAKNVKNSLTARGAWDGWEVWSMARMGDQGFGEEAWKKKHLEDTSLDLRITFK